MDEIQLPKFAQDILLMQACGDCGDLFQIEDAIMAGIRRGEDGVSYFYFEARCKCGRKAGWSVPARPMTMPELGQMISAELSPPKRRPIVFGGPIHLTETKPMGPLLATS